MSLLSACACTLLKGCRARAENSEVVRWDRILLPKKGEGKPLLFFFAEKKIDRQSGFRALREKREKR